MIVYDDVYKDVHDKCVEVIYTGMIWQWSECRGYQQRIQSLVFDRSTGSAIFFLPGWQDEARKGGRSLLLIESKKLGSCSFLQVGACKSGGWSLLPVAAGKFEVFIIRGCFLLPVISGKLFLKGFRGFTPKTWVSTSKIIVYCAPCYLYTRWWYAVIGDLLMYL